MMAQKSGAPLIPVAIIGTYEMFPKGAKRLKRGKLMIFVGKPMHVASDEDRDKVCDTLMEEIAILMTQNGHPTDPPAKRFGTVKELV